MKAVVTGLPFVSSEVVSMVVLNGSSSDSSESNTKMDWSAGLVVLLLFVLLLLLGL